MVVKKRIVKSKKKSQKKVQQRRSRKKTTKRVSKRRSQRRSRKRVSKKKSPKRSLKVRRSRTKSQKKLIVRRKNSRRRKRNNKKQRGGADAAPPPAQKRKSDASLPASPSKRGNYRDWAERFMSEKAATTIATTEGVDDSLFTKQQKKDVNNEMQQIQKDLNDIYGPELTELSATCRPISIKELEEMGFDLPGVARRVGAAAAVVPPPVDRTAAIRRGAAIAIALLKKHGVGASVCIFGFIFPRVGAAGLLLDRMFPKIRKAILNSGFLLTAMLRVVLHNAKTVGRAKIADEIGADFSHQPAEFLLLKKLDHVIVRDAFGNINWDASRNTINRLGDLEKKTLFDTVMANPGM